MKRAAALAACVLAATPAHAQFGKLGEVVRRADQVSELKISEQDERVLGERVSATVRSEFGVLQDAALTRYVSLVGTVLAKASSRPDLKWEFIVLDTDGVNAFAAPGGFVHITRGALGLIKSEAELAGVLGHELAHVTEKHSVNAITKNKTIKLVTDEAGARTSYWYTRLANEVYDDIVERGFDRADEDESDREGARLANKVGYNPAGLPTFLQRLIDRNKDRKAGSKPNGLFSTHPDTKDRIERVTRQIKTEKLTATSMGEARYAQHVTFDAKPAAAVVIASAGTKGAAGADSTQKKEAKEPPKEQKKSGGMLGGLTGRLSSGKEKESTQASASGGGRAVDPTRPDRWSAGGGNPNKVAVSLKAAEIEAFKKGIV